jgi:hypothetical protein
MQFARNPDFRLTAKKKRIGVAREAERKAEADKKTAQIAKSAENANNRAVRMAQRELVMCAADVRAMEAGVLRFGAEAPAKRLQLQLENQQAAYVDDKGKTLWPKELL